MPYCKRMRRDCICGALCVYDRDGRILETDNGTGCMTDTEVKGALIVLMQEWQNRFGGAKARADNRNAQLV